MIIVILVRVYTFAAVDQIYGLVRVYSFAAVDQRYGTHYQLK